MNIEPIKRVKLDHKVKGMPGGVAPFALGRIGDKRWNVLREDLPLPLMVLRGSAVRHNGAWMRAFLERSGAVLSPHGKTTMSPQLFASQFADGSWALTVATTHQMQVARDFGCRRIVLANQLVGRQAIRYVLDELARSPELDFYCLVDSVRNTEALASAARAAQIGRPLNLLLEGGIRGGRTGCRDIESALAVAQAVKAGAPYLALRGVEGFEGLIWDRDASAAAARVDAFLDLLVDIAVAVEQHGLFAEGEVILSAGGSAFYDLVVRAFKDAGVRRPVCIVTRSGCYLTHDSSMYRERFAALRDRSPDIDELGEGLRAALEIWAYVQSCPEPGLAILTMGKRDVSYDDHLPIPLTWHRPNGSGNARPQPLSASHVITNLNDQHAYMTVPHDSPLAIGDMVGCGISHPCLAFDKWQVICVVDDDYTVVDAIKTYF